MSFVDGYKDYNVKISSCTLSVFISDANFHCRPFRFGRFLIPKK